MQGGAAGRAAGTLRLLGLVALGGRPGPLGALCRRPSVGLHIRHDLSRAVARGEKVKTPLAEVFRTSWRQLIIGTFVMLATYTLFYIVTTFLKEKG